MRSLLLLILISLLPSCGTSVPKGSSKDRDNALSDTTPSVEGNKVFFFSLKSSDSNARNLWVDGKRACALSDKTFCRVELSRGPHYLETIFSSDKTAEESVRGMNWSHLMREKFVESVSLKLFVSDTDNGPVHIPMILRGYTDPKHNFYSYWPFSQTKISFGKENVLSELKGYSYSVPLVSAFNTSYVTPKDKKEWELYGNTSSVDSLKSFKEKYPRNVYAGLAQQRLNEMDKDEKKRFDKTISNPSLKKLERFLDSNPSKVRREAALNKLLTFLKTPMMRKKYAIKFPSLTAKLPKSERLSIELLTVGPEGLKVSNIIELTKKGFGTSTLASKIKASQAPYKNFSFDEISQLKSMGVKSPLIDAMIDANTTYEAELKRAQQNKEMMTKIQSLISQSQDKVVAQDIKDNPNTPVECLKQKAALKACGQTSGFLKIACETTAKASFDCNL